MNKNIVSWIIMVLGVFLITKGLMNFFDVSSYALLPLQSWFFWGLILVLIGKEIKGSK